MKDGEFKDREGKNKKKTIIVSIDAMDRFEIKK